MQTKCLLSTTAVAVAAAVDSVFADTDVVTNEHFYSLNLTFVFATLYLLSFNVHDLLVVCGTRSDCRRFASHKHRQKDKSEIFQD